jgi:plastocyanin
VLAALAVAAPAQAADHTVTAGGGANVFAPADVTVVQGDSVTWSNAGGPHNVRFDDDSFEMPAAPDSAAWSVSRTFSALGVFRYYCEAHGLPNGVGMSGTVSVVAAPPPPEPVSADRTAPALRLFGSTRQKLRGRVVQVQAEVNEASKVTARAWVSIPRRGTRRAKTLSTELPARTRAPLGLAFSGKARKAFRRALRKHTRLTARVTVTARDAAGNRTTARRKVRLRP